METEVCYSLSNQDKNPPVILTMPWFRKSRKKHKITKKDISEPTDFKHCYHAVADINSVSGLPPQWSSLMPEAIPEKVPLDTINDDNLIAAKIVSNNGSYHQDTSSVSDKNKYNGNKTGSVSEQENYCSKSNSPIKELNSSGSLKDQNTVNLRSSSKYSLSSTNSSLSLTKRPSPIIRGSDASLEDTIKSIRKHCEHKSRESYHEEEALYSKQSQSPQEKEVVMRHHYHQRPRAGSFMQLRSSPVNRKHIVSYTSSSTTMTQSHDQLPSSSAFCLSAPSEVVQSDLGLYDFNTGSESGSSLTQYCIHSPSNSSGYFGSTTSSLYNSRMSSIQQMPSLPSHHNPQQIYSSSYSPNKPSEFCDATTTSSAISSDTNSAHSGTYHQHRFNSLQRRHNSSNSRSAVGQYSYGYHHPPSSTHGHIGSGGMGRRGRISGHYATAPRSYKQLHSTFNGGSNPYHQRIHEFTEEENLERKSKYRHEPLASTSSGSSTSAQNSSDSSTQSVHRRSERRSSRMNSEQFRMTLELLVNPEDPREAFVDFIKIGEGSTGSVYTARQVSSGLIVAVKKMNLWKQQRRELLFNEVSQNY